MGRKYPKKSVGKIFRELLTLIKSHEFREKNCLSEKDFSRKRKLDFSRLTLFLLQLRSDPYQTKLFRYYAYLQADMPSKAALCKARQKLRPELFHEQDFGTSIALANLTACLASCVVPPPAPRTGRKRKRKPKERKAQVNMRRVMESGKDLLKGLARRNLCKDLLNMTLEYLKTCYDWIDPGRQNERNIKKTPVKSPTATAKKHQIWLKLRVLVVWSNYAKTC